MKIALAIQSYIDWKSTYTTKAFLDYPKVLRRFAEICKKDLERIGPEDIALFRHVLKVKFDLGEYTICQYLIIIKNFLKFQKDGGAKVMNPDLIRIPRNYIVNGHTPITEGEFKRIDASLNRNKLTQLQKKVAIRLLWETGVRVSELCDMKVVQVSDTPRMLIRNKKNNLTRWVFWSPLTHKLLQDFIKKSAPLRSTTFLFLALNKEAMGRLTTRAIQRWIKEAVESAGINKKISPHSFRHGRAHYIKDHNGDILDIAKILGHKNVSSSQHYLKLDPREIEKRARKWLR